MSYQLYRFSDASEKTYGCCIYLKCITKNNSISSSLVASKSRVTPIKRELSIPRLKLLGNLISPRLILIVLNAFQEEIIISCLYAWTDSKVSLAWIKALHKEFQTFVQNRVVKIRKNISSENWSYCLTKVIPSDLITRLDKNIDLSKNSLLWRGPCFLFDKNQSYTKSKYCENKETLSDCFTREFEAKVHWVKANQLRLLKSKTYEHLSKNLSLKFDKENIIRCYSRLENEIENKHPIMLSRNHDLTKLLVLKFHEKALHNGVKQTLNELRNEFWINRGQNYIGNYSIYVLHVNAYNCEVIVTLKNRIYQVTELNVPFHFKFAVLII